MQFQDSHLSDQELVQALDGELSSVRAAKAAAHLAECWSCRARKQAMEAAVVDYVRLHNRSLDPLLPPAAGPRALLKARMAEMAAAPQDRWQILFAWRYSAAAFALVVLVAAIVQYGGHREAPVFRSVPVSFPEPSLTPGVVVTANKKQICDAAPPKNRIVAASLRRKVFEEYGIVAAEPRAYEVDYLITPALGGADDIRNLWPQSYSSAVWNARVKDALEDRLHDLVCEGNLELATAQHDISSDWIAAYKKYFNTDGPLEMAP
jgi:anti-sigma factor RsiW